MLVCKSARGVTILAPCGFATILQQVTGETNDEYHPDHAAVFRVEQSGRRRDRHAGVRRDHDLIACPAVRWSFG